MSVVSVVTGLIYDGNEIQLLKKENEESWCRWEMWKLWQELVVIFWCKVGDILR